MSRKRRIVLLSITLPLLVATWLAAAPLRGQLMARFDVARGHYEVQSFGLPARWKPLCMALLKERYGIEDRVVGDCVVTPWLVGYAHGYGAVVREKMKERHGRDVFEECATEAARRYQQWQDAGAVMPPPWFTPGRPGN